MNDYSVTLCLATLEYQPKAHEAPGVLSDLGMPSQLHTSVQLPTFSKSGKKARRFRHAPKCARFAERCITDNARNKLGSCCNLGTGNPLSVVSRVEFSD